RDAGDVAEFSHGMTVATNALLEGKSARTALVATEGFTDLVALGRQNRAELYRLCAARPAPLVPDELRFGVRERMTPDGPLVPLDADAAGWLASQLREAGGNASETGGNAGETGGNAGETGGNAGEAGRSSGEAE